MHAAWLSAASRAGDILRLFGYVMRPSHYLSQRAISAEKLGADHPLVLAPEFDKSLIGLDLITKAEKISSWMQKNRKHLGLITHLSGYGVKHLSPLVGCLKGLQNITFASQYMTYLPDELGNCRELTELRVVNCRLKSITPAIRTCTKLETLTLNGNRLQILALTLGACSSIKTLEIRENLFTELPMAVSYCTSLTKLDISNNKLTELHPGLQLCKQLTALDVSFNLLTEVPPVCGMLLELRALDLFWNRITYVSPAIAKCTKLERFLLACNPYLNLPKLNRDEILKLVPWVQELDVPEGPASKKQRTALRL